MDEKLDSGEGVQSPATEQGTSPYIKPQGRKPHDPAVTFEEYYYYAQKTREEEKFLEAPKLNWREIVLRKKNEHDIGNNHGQESHHLTGADFTTQSARLEISDEEWTNASRAFRTASWGACQYKPV